MGKSHGRLESSLLSISHREFNMGHYNQRPEHQDYSGAITGLPMLPKSPDPSNLPPQINRSCAYNAAEFSIQSACESFVSTPCAYPQASAQVQQHLSAIVQLGSSLGGRFPGQIHHL